MNPESDSFQVDADLASRVHEKIRLDPVFREDDVIAVTVDQGNVDLGGIVDSWNDHYHATHDAFLAGAKTVSNHIRVRSDPDRSEKKFFYSHDPFR
jgi:hypothetical protein